MNCITRAIAGEQKRLLTLSPVYLLQQHSSFSTPTWGTSGTYGIDWPEVESPPVRETANSVVRKESVNLPKPSEIPWQAKVVNSVNLIGQVLKPVQFQAYPDGKFTAGTIISKGEKISNLEDSSDSSDSQSFWIPVIFEGDLAQSIVSHLREKDYVHVAGHLTVDIAPFDLSDGQPNVQVMAHSINFVEDPMKSELREWAAKKYDTWMDLVDNPGDWVDNREKKRQGLLKTSYPDFKRIDTGVALWLTKPPTKVLEKLEQLEFYTPPSEATSKCEKDGDPWKWDVDGDPWKHLLDNPTKWLDNRTNKINERLPDFKNKDSGKELWLAEAPAWVLYSLPPLKDTDDKKAVPSWAQWADNQF